MPDSFPIPLDATKTRQDETIKLEPEMAIISGRIREPSGQSLAGVKVGTEPTGAAAVPRAFDGDVDIDSDGGFTLRSRRDRAGGSGCSAPRACSRPST